MVAVAVAVVIDGEVAVIMTACEIVTKVVDIEIDVG